MSVDPRSGGLGMTTPRARSPASNVESVAGRKPHASRSCRISGASTSAHSGQTSTSTRRTCIGRCPLPTTISVSSSAISAAAIAVHPQHERSAARAHLEHRAQGSAPGDGMDPTPDRPFGTECADAALGELLRWLRGLPRCSASGHCAGLRVMSSWRPRRRVRTMKPARAMRQSPVSRYASIRRCDGWASGARAISCHRDLSTAWAERPTSVQPGADRVRRIANGLRQMSVSSTIRPG